MKQDLPNPPAMRSDTSYSGSFLKSQEEIVTRTRSSSGNLPSQELGCLDPSGVSEGRGLFQPLLSNPVPLLRLLQAEFPRLSGPGEGGVAGAWPWPW